ncbi:type II toxin-antitoxin system death-on-curing family toxin [Calothrix sp. NIES-2100]|uniref:type II toxin-antitoxin system death-on-curing family toxin n=1 Tax=Calothrix sp. NIES-2100 TaxID=1954172 RepID=UPI0030D9F70A
MSFSATNHDLWWRGTLSDIVEKASALSFSLIKNHPFIDGNKRIGYAVMEVLLVLNGFEINATVDEQEQVILQVASGELGRDEFTQWLRSHIVTLVDFTDFV